MGLAQVMGATVAVHLLLRTGLSELAIAATLATSSFTVVSRLLFGKKDRND